MAAMGGCVCQKHSLSGDPRQPANATGDGAVLLPSTATVSHRWRRKEHARTLPYDGAPLTVDASFEERELAQLARNPSSQIGIGQDKSSGCDLGMGKGRPQRLLQKCLQHNFEVCHVQVVRISRICDPPHAAATPPP